MEHLPELAKTPLDPKKRLFNCRAIRVAGDRRIPFAYHPATKRYVDASAVESGEGCGCFCPGCDEAVIAKHRRKRNTPHFSHHTGSHCPGAFETSLHKAAKQVMAEINSIALPPLKWGPMRPFVFFVTHEELNLGIIQPDVLAKNDEGERLAIEILVSHEIDHAKQEKLKARRLNCVEFDLSKTSREITYDLLVSGFRHNLVKSKWVYHRGEEQWLKEDAQIRVEVQEREARTQEQQRMFLLKLEQDRKEAEGKKIEDERWAKWGGRIDWARD